MHKGTNLVEGTLTEPKGDGGYTGHVSLQRADGSPSQPVEFAGTTNALPTAVVALATLIAASVGLPIDAGVSSGFREGHQFFLEADLAWRAGDRISAEKGLSGRPGARRRRSVGRLGLRWRCRWRD